MSVQPTLFEDRPAPSVGTLNAIVLGMMLRNGGWVMPHEVCDYILRNNKLRISDASASARMRDLRKVKFGGYTVEKRIRAGSRAYEYRIVTGLF